MKQAMDFHFSKKANEEREFQQLVVRENNYSSISNSTDYFIIDIEYQIRKGFRFDLIAVEWPLSSSGRKTPQNPKLIIIEMKYGYKNINGKAGIGKHFTDYNNFISNTQKVDDFKKEMLKVFEQKRDLGLIRFDKKGNNNQIIKFADNIEFAFLFANHIQSSSQLKNELLACQKILAFTPKFIISNFMGYGLCKHSCDIHDLNSFINLL
jgi:hypothetical protein